MSNDARGFITIHNTNIVSEITNVCEKVFDIGIEEISINELYNFPQNFLPTPCKDRNYFTFALGDSPQEVGVSYLIDYINYAPEADIGFPTNGKERLGILLDVISEIFKISQTQKMVIALTDCNQIEKIKKINFIEMRDVIHADFEEYQAPPDTLYEIIA